MNAATPSSGSPSSSSESGETEEPTPAAVLGRPARRRGRRFALSALGVVSVLVVATGLYVFWLYSTTGRIGGVGSALLDPRRAATTAVPGQTVATLAAGGGVEYTTSVEAADTTPDNAPGDPTPGAFTTDPSPIPLPGTPGTVPGLPGPGTGTPATSADTFPDTGPLPDISVDGLDPSSTVDTLPAPLVTIPADQVNNKPLVDTSQVASLGGKNTINILMAGSDNRDNVPDSQAVGLGKGKVSGSRTDTIMIMRIDPDAKKAWVLSLPRDLWVRMPGTNTFDRINAASARSDALLVQTIQENLGIPIHHMMKVDFVGFQRVVAAVGGVNICFDKPARDKVTRLNVTSAGCQRLNATQATAYVRSRYYEEKQADGTWKRDPLSDLGRIKRQQKFIRNGMDAAIGRGFRDPITLNAALKNLRSAIAFDKSLGFGEVLSLANKLRSFDPQSLETFVVPTIGGQIDKKSVLVIDTKSATFLIGQFGHR